MIPGIFVAGTGTDVGKTVVTAGVLRLLRRHGATAGGTAEDRHLPTQVRYGAPALSAMAMKPVQTGCALDSEGRMRASDIEFVLRAAGLSLGAEIVGVEKNGAEMDEETLAHLAPYRFAPACSPHLAARLAGRRIEMETILASARWLAGRYRRLVVEAAGGVMVPLNESHNMLDLAWEMRMPVLLVGHSGLGTINHVLLSLEAIRRRGCEVLGVVLNDTHAILAAESYIHDDNAGSVQLLGKVPVTRISYLGAPPELGRLDANLEQCEFLREFR